MDFARSHDRGEGASRVGRLEERTHLSEADSLFSLSALSFFSSDLSLSLLSADEREDLLSSTSPCSRPCSFSFDHGPIANRTAARRQKEPVSLRPLRPTARQTLKTLD